MKRWPQKGVREFKSTAVMLESVAAVFVWSDRNLPMPLPPGQTLPSAERIVLGEIVGAHGLQGEVRVRVAGDVPDHLLSAEVVWLGKRAKDPEARRRVVVGAGMAPRGEVRLRFEGVSKREDVQGLIGLLITASPDLLPELPEGEFYWYELVGCGVESADGEDVGVVREIWETGAHDVLLVEDSDGVRRLVPTAEALLETIDLAARRIVVADVPGLLDPV